MTAMAWLSHIRNTPVLEKEYNKLTVDERHKAYEESDGDTWNLLQIIEDIIGDRNEQR